MATQSLGYRVENELSKEDFIKLAWITLAKEDAPLEAFNGNFEDVSDIKHEVVVGTADAELSYQASVGYDRRESHLETESYYDFNDKGQRKQRLVTKNEIVTDWRVVSNQYSTSSTAMVENVSGVDLDRSRLKESLLAHDSLALNKAIKNGAKEKVEVSDDTLQRLYAAHKYNFDLAVAHTLPGDRYKDLVVTVDSMENKGSEIYLLTEYATSISCGGKKYNKLAFPFGYMQIGGDKIESSESAANFEKKQLKMLSDNEKERRASHGKRRWESVKKWVFITGALMLIAFSSGLLFFLPPFVTTLIGLPFPISLVYTIVKWIQSDKKVSDSIAKENEEEKTRVHKEIKDYAKKRKAAILEALNNKLASLGMDAVSEDII